MVLTAVIRLPPHDRDRIFAAMFLIFGSILFWALFEQAGSSLNLYTDRHVDRSGVPASMFQSINAIYIVLLGPVFAGLWTWLARHGLEDLGARLNRMTKAGQWDRIAAEISDDVVNLFAAIGRHDEIAAAIAQRFGGASDAIFASVATAVPADLPPDLVQDIRRLPAVFTGFRR